MSILIRSRQFRPLLSAKTQISTILLQLPASYRSFHASPQHHFLDVAISAAHTVFDTVHSSTGLPWAYTIPLAALTIRTTLILPIAIYSRYKNQKQVPLAPLMAAWQHSLRKETMKEFGHLGPTLANSALLRKTRRKRNEIYKRFDCELWKNYLPLIQLPIWLTAIEAVRKMCGRESGLLGMLAARLQGRGGDEATSIEASVQSDIPIEQSLATEGALWFPDLLSPDPQMILPFVLSGVILLNLSSAGGNSVWQRRLRRSLGLVALAVGPLTLQVPSAMLIYWISSTTLAYMQATALDKVMPTKLSVVPCKPRRSRGLQGEVMDGKS